MLLEAPQVSANIFLLFAFALVVFVSLYHGIIWGAFCLNLALSFILGVFLATLYYKSPLEARFMIATLPKNIFMKRLWVTIRVISFYICAFGVHLF